MYYLLVAHLILFIVPELPVTKQHASEVPRVPYIAYIYFDHANK